MRVLHVVAETPGSFLQHLKEVTYIERKPLRFCAKRLASLIKTLELNDLNELGTLKSIYISSVSPESGCVCYACFDIPEGIYAYFGTLSK
jgi:hypothetical protein